MKSSTATNPKHFISPVPVLTKLEFDYEYHKCDRMEGYLIDLMDEKGEVNEVFFLPCDRDAIEKWICKNGIEDQDYEWTEDWSGGFRSASPQVIEDAYESNVREYILTHRSNWKQHE